MYENYASFNETAQTLFVQAVKDSLDLTNDMIGEDPDSLTFAQALQNAVTCLATTLDPDDANEDKVVTPKMRKALEEILRDSLVVTFRPHQPVFHRPRERE